jgi:protein-S-isoprenylcysteine O-methyltransferase Ste14
MPLSEQEQRLLDEMERHLMRNDADVVTAPRDGRSLSYRNIVYGTVLVLLGLGGLIVGVATDLEVVSIIVGVIGFLVMLGGVILAVTPTRGTARTTPDAPKPATARAGTSFMDRMNDRWDRRQGER